MSGFAFRPTKNKAVAGLGDSCDNRGHQTTLVLKIQANFKLSTSFKTIIIYLHFVMPWLQCDWTGFLAGGLELGCAHTPVNLATSTCSQSTCSYNFPTWAPQKSTGGETIYYTGKSIGQHEKILSGEQCFGKTKMEDKSYFFSCCKLRI